MWSQCLSYASGEKRHRDLNTHFAHLISHQIVYCLCIISNFHIMIIHQIALPKCIICKALLYTKGREGF